MSKITVVIADDHPMVRSGLKNILDREPDFEVVGEASDGEEALLAIQKFNPAVAIIDISMPKMNGAETTRVVVKKFPQTRILILTMHEDEAYIGKLIEAGAHGYILKDSSGEEIVKALRRVASGERYFSSSAYQLIGKRFSENKKNPAVDDEALSSLTPRELEILNFIADGMSTPDIAKKLFLSPRTVDTHRANIMHKLRVHTATALVRLAIEKGLVKTKKM
ncbi:MAG: response regulator transcription factor [Bacteroidetes bacterium]|nr:response regulator transcription factor [Bacteroidota bacterium]